MVSLSIVYCVYVEVLYLGTMLYCFFFFFFKQKTAYEMRISDWSSDVCSSDLRNCRVEPCARLLMRMPAVPLVLIGGRRFGKHAACQMMSCPSLLPRKRVSWRRRRMRGFPPCRSPSMWRPIIKRRVYR